MGGMTISVRGADALRRKLGQITSPDMKRNLMNHVALATVGRIRDHISQVAPNHHKTADRLGATPTHHLEYAPGRTEIASVSETSCTIAIRNTPGLLRAFGPVTITPKKAKALTIPIHRIAYGMRAGDLKRNGHVLFRIKGRNGNGILAEKDGSKRGGIRPLYALVKKAVVPQDASLLPTREELSQVAQRAARGFFRALDL